MKKLQFTFFLFIGLFSFAQNGIIKGKIIDKLSEKPLKDVIVIF